MNRTPAVQERLDPRSLLSPSENKVLQTLSEGKAPKEIAFELKLSEKTVYAHCKSIEQRLGLRDLHELMLYAARLPKQSGGQVSDGKQNSNIRQSAAKKQ